MRRLIAVLIVLIACMAVSQTVHAGAGASLKVGTLGPGLDLTVGLSDRTNLRLGVNALTLDLDFDSDDDEEGGSTSGEEIDAEIDFMTVGAILDWHPGDGAFRLSAGVILNNNEVNLTADINEAVEINNNEYSVSDLTGNIGFNSLAPYVGIGWGNAVDENGRWSFLMDIGVMYQGAPDVELSATANDPAVQAQLDADIQAEIDEQEDDADVVSFWPVIALGFSYRF